MKGSNRKYTDEELIEQVRKVYNKNLKVDASILKESDFCSYYAVNKWIGNLDEIAEKADIQTGCTDNKINEQRVKAKMREMERNKKRVVESNIPKELQTFLKRSNKNFVEIREDASLIREHGGNESTFNRSKIEMIEQLRKIDEPVKQSNIKEHTEWTVKDYEYDFGSTDNALNIAGLISIQHTSEMWHRMTGEWKVDDALKSIEGYNPEKNHYVYRLHFDDCYYIGATRRLKRRIQEKEYWPDDEPIDIDVESFDSKEKCKQREKELPFETAIEFDTNNVYGGRVAYR